MIIQYLKILGSVKGITHYTFTFLGVKYIASLYDGKSHLHLYPWPKRNPFLAYPQDPALSVEDNITKAANYFIA